MQWIHITWLHLYREVWCSGKVRTCVWSAPTSNLGHIKYYFYLYLSLFRSITSLARVNVTKSFLYLAQQPKSGLGRLSAVVFISRAIRQARADSRWESSERVISSSKSLLPIQYRVSQEECEILWESVPWVKLYRYNPKHLYPKLNVYGDNGQSSLKLWHLLHTYWLPNSYWNWLEYVVSAMLISVLNIKVTCEWHKAIKLNYKNSRIHVFALLGLRSTVRRPPDRLLSCDVRATVL